MRGGGPKSLIFGLQWVLKKIPLNLLKNGTQNNNSNPKPFFSYLAQIFKTFLNNIVFGWYLICLNAVWWFHTVYWISHLLKFSYLRKGWNFNSCVRAYLQPLSINIHNKDLWCIFELYAQQTQLFFDYYLFVLL